MKADDVEVVFARIVSYILPSLYGKVFKKKKKKKKTAKSVFIYSVYMFNATSKSI